MREAANLGEPAAAKPPAFGRAMQELALRAGSVSGTGASSGAVWSRAMSDVPVFGRRAPHDLITRKPDVAAAPVHPVATPPAAAAPPPGAGIGVAAELRTMCLPGSIPAWSPA